MTEDMRSVLETLFKLFLYALYMGIAILFLWLVVILLGGEAIRKFHGSMFGLPPHEIMYINYMLLGATKVAVLLLFGCPCLAIKIVLRQNKTASKN
ncbi:MAG: hypothetical protein RBU29_01905 [bacterium]|jgi:hypothetical protein|nr:hypothetical protein [bacterium]